MKIVRRLSDSVAIYLLADNELVSIDANGLHGAVRALDIRPETHDVVTDVPAPAFWHGGVLAWDGEEWSVVDQTAYDAAVAAALAARKAVMLSDLRARFRQVRDQGTTIDFGTGPVSIQTTEGAANDIQRLHDDLRLRAAAGEVDPTQDIATSEYVVVPNVTIAMAAAMREAVAAHWRATWARDAALGGAVQTAANAAALDLIDIPVGSINGVGSWPANGA